MKQILIALSAVALMGAAPSPWRTPDPDTLLVIETSKGRIVVEMRPDLAPRPAPHLFRESFLLILSTNHVFRPVWKPKVSSKYIVI